MLKEYLKTNQQIAVQYLNKFHLKVHFIFLFNGIKNESGRLKYKKIAGKAKFLGQIFTPSV